MANTGSTAVVKMVMTLNMCLSNISICPKKRSETQTFPHSRFRMIVFDRFEFLNVEQLHAIVLESAFFFITFVLVLYKLLFYLYFYCRVDFEC